jgi:hypothetical protein
MSCTTAISEIGIVLIENELLSKVVFTQAIELYILSIFLVMAIGKDMKYSFETVSLSD